MPLPESGGGKVAAIPNAIAARLFVALATQHAQSTAEHLAQRAFDLQEVFLAEQVKRQQKSSE